MTGADERRTGRRGARAARVSGGWQLPESHLLPDAVVAFVDGELSPAAHERAAMHLVRCVSCASEIAAQRQVRAAMNESWTPSLPAGLLASLHSIPDSTTLSTVPDNLAVTADGELVAVQRPDRAPAGSAPLGSSEALGSTAVAGGHRGGRRAVQGAGVVMSGLMLSALALVATVDDDGRDGVRGGDGRTANTGVRQATLPASAPTTTTTTPVTLMGITGR